MRAALENLGERFTESFYQVVIINSLPSDYGDIMKTWELTHPDLKRTELLLNILQMHQPAVRENPTPQALIVNKKKEAWGAMSIEEKKKVSKCKACGKKGHWANDAECSNKQQSANVLFSLGNIGADLRDKWVADSGATSHMANRREWFRNLVMYDKPLEASVGDGKKVAILGVGDIEIKTKIGGRVIPGTLKNVSFIPTLATNLFSVGTATEKGMSAKFEKDACWLTSNGRVVASGARVDDELYVLDLEVLVKEEIAAPLVKERSLDDWHAVLGHAGLDKVKQLLNDPAIDAKIKEAVRAVCKCPECPAGKAERVSHPSRDVQQEHGAGEFITMDLVHLGNKDGLYGEYNYYLLCKDYQSEFLFCYLLKDKQAEGVKRCIEQLIIDIEHASGRIVKRIHSDNGSEFVNEQLKLHLLKERILHTTSAPEVPQQNGVIERGVQTTKYGAHPHVCLRFAPQYHARGTHDLLLSIESLTHQAQQIDSV